MDDTIYIPRHRLDVGEMADLAFRKGWKVVTRYAVMVAGLLGFANYVFFAPIFGLTVPMVVLISVVIGLLTAFQSFRATRAGFARMALNFAFGDRTIYFNQRSITIEYAIGATSTYPWTCFQKAEWRPELLLMHLTVSQYVTIPRRFLDDRMENAIKQALITASQQKGLLPPPPLA